jgi:hypothetical protein
MKKLLTVLFVALGLFASPAQAALMSGGAYWFSPQGGCAGATREAVVACASANLSQQGVPLSDITLTETSFSGFVDGNPYDFVLDYYPSGYAGQNTSSDAAWASVIDDPQDPNSRRNFDFENEDPAVLEWFVFSPSVLSAAYAGYVPSPSGNAPNMSALTSGVDFSGVITALLLVFASLALLYVAYKGGRFVLSALRGPVSSAASSAPSLDWDAINEEQERIIYSVQREEQGAG